MPVVTVAASLQKPGVKFRLACPSNRANRGNLSKNKSIDEKEGSQNEVAETKVTKAGVRAAAGASSGSQNRVPLAWVGTSHVSPVLTSPPAGVKVQERRSRWPRWSHMASHLRW